MAKLTAPLLSLEARGAIGEALVYFPWKGRNVARQWTKPANPRDIDQKLIRQKLAAMGKNCKAIVTPETGLLNGSAIYQLIKDETPATQIWNAFFVKSALDDLKVDSAFTTLSAAIAAVDAITTWQSEAINVGFGTLTGPSYATAITPEMQFAMGAYAAYKLSLSGLVDYATAPENWDTEMITSFAADYVTVA